MSKRQEPTWAGVVDRAVGDQKRTARLQSLIITVTCCLVVIAALLAAVIALSGGHAILSMGLGAIPALLWAVSKLRKRIKGSPNA
ncbi:hypothetical protein [Pseudarthrobacter equi]|uniref:hypothetical protein n=1 Tax=Pseudarthrobacter equi TaxID=728066 RepID=UPI0028D1CAE7|nr:hypothetical protein [Pseudarthrobacter equi]